MSNISDENQQKAVFGDEQTQKELNTPLSDPTGVGSDNEEFLKLLVSLIEKGEIDLYKPATLINQPVYAPLDEKTRGQIDFEAMNLLAAIRDIKGLYDAGYKDTFQMQNLVDRVHDTKKRLEDEGGDIFII